jgi:cytochrome c oxidase cbb3-type subunit 3
MADDKPREVDDVTGTETTGHQWDGIKELDTPLPRWWLYIFYASILFSIGYWVMMPAWPTFGPGGGFTPGVRNHSDRVLVAQDVAAIQAARAPNFEKILSMSSEAAEANPDMLAFARAAGEAAFGENCAQCHGAGAQGAKGYPNLNDDVWIWDGTLAGIEQTLNIGIRSDHPETRFSQMPAYGRDKLLEPKAIEDVTEYVVQIAGGPADATKARRGFETFAAQCVSCHTAAGTGDRAQGAPNLTDREWLKAGPAASERQDWAAIRTSIRAQLETGSGGVMPAWSSRLDAGTIRALAIYVHTLGGGEAPAPAPADAPAPAAAPEEAAPTSFTAPVKAN